MKLTAVVIIYNSKLSESHTLQSIIRCCLKEVSLTIQIWNNGPDLLAEDDTQDFFILCESKNIKVKIYQDIRNIALSKVYNFFANKNDYDFISILDQDSVLPEDFISNIKQHRDVEIILPKIIAKKNDKFTQIYPHTYCDADALIEDGKINVSVDSVMSGITMSADIVRKIIIFRGYLFEEKLAFYGIDCDLFRSIKSMADNGALINLYCIGSICHSFAFFDPEVAKNEFRQMELFYYKFYIRQAYSKKSMLSTLWVCIRDFLRRKNSLEKTKNLIRFTLDGAHPRSKIEIIPDMHPTHELV